MKSASEIVFFPLDSVLKASSMSISIPSCVIREGGRGRVSERGRVNERGRERVREREEEREIERVRKREREGEERE